MQKPKIIAIVSSPHISLTIREDLEFILGKAVRYICLDIDNLDMEKKTICDLVLITHPIGAQLMKKKVGGNVPVMLIQRTIFEKDIVPLLKLPIGTKILVVNDSDHMAGETFDRLTNLNLPNITFFPMWKDTDTSAFHIALTPGEPSFVPKHINSIIDIGNRHLSVTTILDVLTHLQLMGDEYTSRLISYSNLTIDDNVGLKNQYRNSVAFNSQVTNLLKHIGQGVLVVSADKKILFYNNKLEELLEHTADSLSFDELFEPKIALALWSLTEEKNSCAFQIGEKEILAEFDLELISGEEQRFYCFSDVTYLRFLENSMKSRAIASGFIAKHSFHDIVYQSEEMQKCIELIQMFAHSEKTVLIQGESGTGKELLAQSLHNASARKAAPFVAINCAALPESLLESELFGYEKGAFTGAIQSGKTGLFEQAQHGTLFLDEIGDMPLSLQVRLLRVLQEREILRVGGTRVIPIDVRIVAATNQDLMAKAKKGEFRTDLYYRLNVLPITIPPLRQRTKDIMPLFYHFINQNSVPESIKNVLCRYSWPGNVRELQNVAEYFTMMKNTSQSLPSFLFQPAEIPAGINESLENTIIRVLREKGPLGRSRLCKLLSVSEYSIRKELISLQKKGLIRVNRGRGGIEVLY